MRVALTLAMAGCRHRRRFAVFRLMHAWLFGAALVTGCLVAGAARAHPHVWVTMTTEVLYAPDGTATGLRQAWTFDDMYSAFAVTGIVGKIKGQFTREELQPLAKLNADSLKDFDYFTYARIDGKRWKDAFVDPVDYWLTYDPKATTLTLHFTLPFKQPVKAKVLRIDIYDPEFFIDFGFATNQSAKLIGAPPKCALWTEKPPDPNFQSSNLDKSFVPSEAFIGMGMDFANKIMVECQ
jgi:ABC-type uncharacterized transport system substrate-binding protein